MFNLSIAWQRLPYIDHTMLRYSNYPFQAAPQTNLLILRPNVWKVAARVGQLENKEKIAHGGAHDVLMQLSRLLI